MRGECCKAIRRRRKDDEGDVGQEGSTAIAQDEARVKVAGPPSLPIRERARVVVQDAARLIQLQHAGDADVGNRNVEGGREGLLHGAQLPRKRHVSHGGYRAGKTHAHSQQVADSWDAALGIQRSGARDGNHRGPVQLDA